MTNELVEKYSLKDVWQFFLEAVCRFFNNRFQEEKPSRELRLIYEELEYFQRENAKLVSSLIELSSAKSETESNDSTTEMKPIRQFQPSWSVKRRQLEKQARANAEALRVQVPSEELTAEISSLESELNLGAN